ncbi:MAG: hypothetical protein K0U45_07775 [Alphaproteobacteria bacterium]|nr:hypothetical protein [Alphaproteobacteria bacterium]
MNSNIVGNIFGGARRFIVNCDEAQSNATQTDAQQNDSFHQAGKYPLRNLWQTLKMLWQEQDLKLPDDFLDDLVQQGALLPAQKIVYLALLQQFITQFSEAKSHHKQYDALQQLLYALIKQNAGSHNQSKQPEFSETPMPAHDFTHHVAHQDARLIGYQLGNEARKYLALKRVNGQTPSIMEAIQHAKETIRRVS